ncbi:MAG: 30S ribosomal protein S6 [Enterobacterales bacterium]
MLHYEIIFIFKPYKIEKILNIIEKFTNYIKKNSGFIHRKEDWGCRSLSYNINKEIKAYYFLINLEISFKILEKIKNNIKFNELIIRIFIIKVKKIIKKSSYIMKLKKNKNWKKNKIRNLKK